MARTPSTGARVQPSSPELPRVFGSTVRPELVLAGVLALFTLGHLIRLDLVLANADGQNYLRSAVRLAGGEFARSRYSPGWGILLAPLARFTRQDFWLMYSAAGVLNIALSVLGLVLVYHFLKRYLSAASSLTLVAILALGETATTVLIGAEVEPLALLCVTGTLVALQEERTWLAVVLTGLGTLARVALAPFFLVLWLLRLRREPRPALASIAWLVLGLVAYLASQPRSGTYGDIATDTYGSGSNGLFDIVPDHVYRYIRLGIPSVLWPVRLLTAPLGFTLGIVTTCVTAVGVWQLLRNRTRLGLDDPGGVLMPAIVGGLAYLGALTFWPTNNGALVRFVMPIAGLVLLSLTVGFCHLARSIPARLSEPGCRVVVVAPLVAAVLATGALVATRNRNTGAIRAFLVATEQARDQLPRATVLATRYGAYTELMTGRRTVAYDGGPALSEFYRAAKNADACAVVIDESSDQPKATALRGRLERDGAAVIASDGQTSVLAIERKGCPN